jgi:hypothetical protein
MPLGYDFIPAVVYSSPSGKAKREVPMVRLITRGRFTQSYIKGLVEAPEDREPAVCES